MTSNSVVQKDLRAVGSGTGGSQGSVYVVSLGTYVMF